MHSPSPSNKAVSTNKDLLFIKDHWGWGESFSKRRPSLYQPLHTPGTHLESNPDPPHPGLCLPLPARHVGRSWGEMPTWDPVPNYQRYASLTWLRRRLGTTAVLPVACWWCTVHPREEEDTARHLPFLLAFLLAPSVIAHKNYSDFSTVWML